MQHPIQHLYKRDSHGNGILYAWFPSMHTRMDFILWGEQDEDTFKSVVDEAFLTIQQIEQVGNYFNPQSEIAYVNRTAYLHPIHISPMLYDLVDKGKIFFERTCGLFDIAISSHDYRHTDISDVILSPTEQTVLFRREGITLNFSGILKGYALDAIRPLLEEKQIHHALINMGNSSVLALGDQPNGNGWNVAFLSDGEKTIQLFNECLTTSGNDTDTRKHILNPLTQTYVSGKSQIAVVTKDGTSGEALSTALFIADDGMRAQITRHLPCRIVL